MTRIRRFRSIPTLAALVGLMLSTGAQSSQAASVTLTTPTGATTSGGVVDASVNFNTNTAGQLVITLTNLLASPTDVAQTISDLSFTLSNGTLTGATSDSLTAPVHLITINSDGSVTDNGTGAAGWVFTSPTSTTGLLDVLNGPGHAGPAHEIIGPGPYTTANNSIAGNGPHNPFIDQTATFTISGSGITTDTTVSSATFTFGTSAESVPAVPEPSTFAITLSGLGTIGLAALCRHRRRSEEASA